MPFYKVLLYAHAIQVMEGTDTRWMHSDANTPKITLDNINKYLEEI